MQNRIVLLMHIECDIFRFPVLIGNSHIQNSLLKSENR